MAWWLCKSAWFSATFPIQIPTINFRFTQKLLSSKYLHSKQTKWQWHEGTIVRIFNIQSSLSCLALLPKRFWRLHIIRLALKRGSILHEWIYRTREQTSGYGRLCLWIVSPVWTCRHHNKGSASLCDQRKPFVIDTLSVSLSATACDNLFGRLYRKSLKNSPKIIPQTFADKSILHFKHKISFVMKTSPPSVDHHFDKQQKQQHHKPQQCLALILIAIQCGWSPW